MPVARKRELVKLCGEFDVVLIEDDVYGDLQFDGARPLPCKAFDRDGRVLLCSSFSKSLAPGARLGFIVPGRYRDMLRAAKHMISGATPLLQQEMLADFLQSGRYERHLRRMREGADVAREIETLVSDLAWRRARRDPVFEGLMREWKRIEVHYEPVNPSRLFDPARGALIVHLLFNSTQGTWLEVGTQDTPQADVVRQMGLILSALPELNARRQQVIVPLLYRSYPEPAPAQVTKVYAGGWGSAVPIAVPQEGRIELILQSLPGEQRAAVLDELESWLAGVIERHPQDFATRPQIHFPRRWMVPTAMDKGHPLVTTLAGSVAQVTGRQPAVLGAPYPCDLFALQKIFGMPALIFGPSGANAHAPDEYVELESIFQFWESLLLFVMQWCGI